MNRSIPNDLDQLVEEAKESKPLTKEEVANDFGI
jgi:hypothetical protein